MGKLDRSELLSSCKSCGTYVTQRNIKGKYKLTSLKYIYTWKVIILSPMHLLCHRQLLLLAVVFYFILFFKFFDVTFIECVCSSSIFVS